MRSKIRAILRRSAFAVGAVRALRGARADLRALSWSVSRRSQIRRYLETTRPRKLHLGASHNQLSGWLNTDLSPLQRSVRLDVTRPFPLDDESIDYILAEHLIEHIEYGEAAMMLRECHRVLRPGGKIRIATPDLEVLIGLHSRDKTEAQVRYIDWIVRECLPSVQDCSDVFVINNAFHAWGHHFLYDRSTLVMTLSNAGFGDITYHRPGESDDPELRNLEAHGKEIGNEEVNRFETFVVEGRALKGEAVGGRLDT